MASPALSAPPGLLTATLACPTCRTPVVAVTSPAVDASMCCRSCGATYRVVNGVLDLRPLASVQKPEEIAWSEHWSASNQESVSQRFFSFYRKAVFARAVAYFVDRYLARTGVLLEAGSGTSETSMSIDKRAGN